MSFYFLHRGWMDHHLFRDQPYSEREAWVYLIEKANFEPTTYRQAGKLYTIPRGDIATSYRALSEKWKWSTNKAIRFLKLLISDLMISIKTEHNFLWITICNYDTYQNPLIKKETETELKRNTDGTRTDTDSNTNVITKELKKDTYNAQGDYEKIYETGSNLFFHLVTANSSSIHQWLSSDCSAELDIIPEIKRHAGKDIRSWSFFTPGITAAKSIRSAPLPEAAPRQSTYKSFEQQARDKTDLAIQEVMRRASQPS